MQTERQMEITEAAFELIASKGIQGVTIKNISKKIGISEPAIYRHFDSKTSILLSILHGFKDMATMLSNLLATNTDQAVDKIGFIFEKMLDLFTETPSIVSVIFAEEIFKNEEVLKTKIVEIVNIHAQTIEDIVEKGQLENNVRNDIDKQSIALMAMGSFRLLVKKWDLNNHDFDLRTEGNKLIEVLRKVLAK
ncbi:MAG: TetR/AcrR family transcriptional regulator [Bacteroidales bacterium]|nr:TetR/AcrR family transcriptional regulator [Bacteroidales bacterium]MCF8455903.1 TetR/AcrR family transcriptional regulator [Bacteroidales bacterium]